MKRWEYIDGFYLNNDTLEAYDGEAVAHILNWYDNLVIDLEDEKEHYAELYNEEVSTK